MGKARDSKMARKVQRLLAEIGHTVSYQRILMAVRARFESDAVRGPGWHAQVEQELFKKFAAEGSK